MGSEKCVGVVGDWDADGVVSSAEIVYAQEFLGLYPEREKMRTVLAPAGPRTIDEALKHISESGCRTLVLLDIPYTSGVLSSLKRYRESFSRIIYVDHHLSSIVNSRRLEDVVDELFLGKAPTAVLVSHIIKSCGGRLTPRLEAFVSAAAFTERGGDRRSFARYRRLVAIVVAVSRKLSHERNRDLWERLVRWLASPLTMAAMPFSTDIARMVEVRDLEKHLKELRYLAMELAPSALRVANVRIVDASKLRDVKLSALASQLYRVLRAPVIVVGVRKGRRIAVIRSRDDLPYRLALKLYEKGVAKDLGGHQSIAVLVLRDDVDVRKLAEEVMRCLYEI